MVTILGVYQLELTKERVEHHTTRTRVPLPGPYYAIELKRSDSDTIYYHLFDMNKEYVCNAMVWDICNKQEPQYCGSQQTHPIVALYWKIAFITDLKSNLAKAWKKYGDKVGQWFLHYAHPQWKDERYIVI